MKKITYKILLILIVIFSLNSCEKVIDLSLESEKDILDVIDAGVYDSTLFVIITKSSNNYFKGEIQSVSDAKITLEVDKNTFTMDKNNYEKNPNIMGGKQGDDYDNIIFGGILKDEVREGFLLRDPRIYGGKNYKLRVEIDGNVYTSEEKGFEISKVDTIEIREPQFNPITGSTDEGINIKMKSYPEDFEAISVLERIKLFNGDIILNNDTLLNYTYHDINIFEEQRDLSVGYNRYEESTFTFAKMDIFISLTSKNVYKYREALDKLTGQGPPSAVSSPENPITNIKIEKSNKSKVLGYFKVYNFIRIHKRLEKNNL